MHQILPDETRTAGDQDSMHQNLRPAALVGAAEIVNTMQRGLNAERNALLHLYLPRSMAIAETQSGRGQY
jgi:hypothetical protein